MNFDDVYKTMLLNRGGNVNNSDIRNSKDSINRKFKNDPSYKLATLKKRDINIEESDLDTRIVNHDNDTKKKKLYVRPDTNVEVGDYIIYPNKTYLILQIEDNLISPYADSTECNHDLKWMYKDNLNDTLSIVTNATKYTEGTKDIAVGITEVDARLSVNIPFTQKTKTITLGQRFIINNTAWKTTQTDFTTVQGLMTLTLGKDSINYETDDVINGIADKWVHKYTISLASTSQSVVIDGTYEINPVVKDNGKEVSNENVTYKSSDETIATVDSSGKVTAIKQGSCVISCNIGEVKTDLSLSIIAKTTIPITNYSTNWTNNNGSLLRLMSSSNMTATKLIDNVEDTSLVIAYTGDATFNSLLSQKKISITKVNDRSYTIKNIGVNSGSYTINITFTDSSTGALIETKTIQLKGV